MSTNRSKLYENNEIFITFNNINQYFCERRRKKRDYVKIPKKLDNFAHRKVSKLVDAIILYNRSVFGNTECHKTNMASLWDRYNDDRFFIEYNKKKLRKLARRIATEKGFTEAQYEEKYAQLQEKAWQEKEIARKAYGQAGMYVKTKEEYQEQYAHLKTSEEKASEKLKMMKFPENPDFSLLAEDKDKIETCKKCIELLKKYNEGVISILSAENKYKGGWPLENSMPSEIYIQTLLEYPDCGNNEKVCEKLFEEINFYEQIEEASGISFEKFYKAFELLAGRYVGFPNPLSLFKK